MRSRAPLARLVAALSLVLAASPSLAVPKFDVPPLHSHLVDTANLLTPGERLALDQKMALIQQKSGYEIVAFLCGSLAGQEIEDVAYAAFNQWGIGRANKDNGVLLVIAPKEHKVRIETGKGVGGALTDLKSNDILRRVIDPLLKNGQFRDAIDQGVTAIGAALAAGTAPDPAAAPPPPPTGTQGSTRPQAAPRQPLDLMTILMMIGGAGLFITLMIVSSTFRSMMWFVLRIAFFFTGRGGGGGGGGGGSGYSGGGGKSGGGGSSDGF